MIWLQLLPEHLFPATALERQSQTGDGWPYKRLQPWKLLVKQSYVQSARPAVLLPLLLEEVMTLYLKKSWKSASPGKPEPMEIHKEIP